MTLRQQAMPQIAQQAARQNRVGATGFGTDIEGARGRTRLTQCPARAMELALRDPPETRLTRHLDAGQVARGIAERVLDEHAHGTVDAQDRRVPALRKKLEEVHPPPI
jgi:hypothetical protein